MARGRSKNASSKAPVGTIPPQDANVGGDEALDPPIVRFSVNLARDSAQILRFTAAEKGMTVTDVFRRAISIMEAIDEELALGNDIQSVDRMGNRTRIIFR